MFTLWQLIAPVPGKILNFTGKVPTEYDSNEDQSWPVIPRKKPLIVSPQIILDMPELDTNLCHNILDWGRKGHIASLYDGEIHIWHPTQPKPLQTYTNQTVNYCVKWDRAGKRLAVVINNSTIFVINALSTTSEVLFERQCCKNSTKKCTVNSLTWSKDDVLLSGCSNGNLTSWFLLCRVERRIGKAHNGAIIAIQFSCHEQYLATSGLDNAIRIWTWPELTYVCGICCYLPVKAFAWHPWRESLLMCAGGKSNNVVSLWNTSTMKEVDWYKSENDNYIDAMTFNKKTGELVVSFYDSSERTMIAIFSNFVEISDAIIWHLGRVPYLLWNSNYTKLLTAGSDENLCIWNFFGKNKKTLPTKSTKQGEFSTNPIKNLNCFRQCIR